MNWLIDTNVISETRKRQPSENVMAWISSAVLSNLFTSSMNLAELLYGANKVEDVLKKRDLEKWIEAIVRPWFIGRILEVDESVLLRWRIMSRARELAREPAPGADLLIAAVAQEHRLGVVTRDVVVFVACGLPVLNPWTGERFNGA
jgi:toxin FitB